MQRIDNENNRTKQVKNNKRISAHVDLLLLEVGGKELLLRLGSHDVAATDELKP